MANGIAHGSCRVWRAEWETATRHGRVAAVLEGARNACHPALVAAIRGHMHCSRPIHGGLGLSKPHPESGASTLSVERPLALTLSSDWLGLSKDPRPQLPTQPVLEPSLRLHILAAFRILSHC